MRYERGWLERIRIVTCVLVSGLLAAGCGLGFEVDPPDGTASAAPNPAPVANSKGTGVLTVSVSDLYGRPLARAHVSVRVAVNSVGGVFHSAVTDTAGTATFNSVAAESEVSVSHWLGEHYVDKNVKVAQEAVTLFPVTLRPSRPQPTAALLPVTIPASSVSADRRELTLQAIVVASAAAPFIPSGFWFDATPAIGLELEGTRLCAVWLDATRTTPSCGDSLPSNSGPYSVSVQHYSNEPTGIVPALAEPGPARNVMLIFDQSARVAQLDPAKRRSFAARQFIARTTAASDPMSLSIAGLAGDGGDPAMPRVLPAQPLWVLRGAGTAFTWDRPVLDAAVEVLEPLVGGAAPVYAALQSALTVSAAEAPTGRSAVIAMLGGGDDSDMSDAARRAELEALRQQRDDARIQVVLIAGAADNAERQAIAGLAAALRAPTVALGIMDSSSGTLEQSWEGGAFAAWDLAADLIDGQPLPTISTGFRLHTDQPGGFAAGASLHGAIRLESCNWDSCVTFPINFVVEIP